MIDTLCSTYGGAWMTDQEIDDLLAAYGGGCEIPVPRSGQSYELWLADVEGRHGCLDAAVFD